MMNGAEPGLTLRTLRSMVWTGGGVAAELALQVVVIMILARLLTPADFGVVAVALVVTGFVGIFGELGLIPALIQREKLEPAHIRTAFTGSLAFALVIGAVLWGLSPFVARVFGTPTVAPMMCVLAWSLSIRAWGNVPSALLQRAMRFRAVSLANVLSYLVGFGAVGVGMAVAGFGAWSLVAAHMVQVFVHGLIAHIAWPVSHRPGIDRQALGELLSYGGGVSFARLANYLATRGDNMVVGHTLGPTALGLYGPAYHLMALPADLFQRIVQTVLFPAISRLQTEPERLALAYRRGLAVTGLTVLPGTMLAILLAPEVVDVLLGPRWHGVTVPLQILAAGMFFRVGYKISVVFVKATGAVRQFALRQIPYPLMVLAFSWFGTRWGISGVAAGVVAALGVHYLLLTTLGLRVARLSPRDYVAAHRSALLLSGAIFLQAWIAIAGARAAQLPPWAGLTIVALSTCAATAALIRWVPISVLGAEGIWFRHALATFVAPPLAIVRRIPSAIGTRLRWHPVSVAVRLLTHALRNGLWRSLSPGIRKVPYEQQVLTWSTSIPDRPDSTDIVAYLRQAGVRVHEGGNAFYLPPQPRLAEMLGAAVEGYPPGSGFKVLRDFRGVDEAHYLHPRRQTRLRRRLIGTPRDQLIAANYLHRLGLGPRVWDVCLLRAGPVPMPAFVVQHVEGTAPDADECAAFLQRLRITLSETELRISVPNWERSKDFRCPTCNHNLLRDATGALNYIDFQNFTVRNPQRILESMVDGATAPSLFRRRRTTAGDGTERFHTAQDLLRLHGIDVRNRLVLDIGCQAGVMLHHALSAGAWWALGWDRPAAVMRAQRIAVALGFTRLDVIPADLDARYDVGASVPSWLGRHLDEAVVFFLAMHRHVGIAASLVDLPWRALVYEGRHRESSMEASERVRAFTTRGARLAHQTHARDADSRERPLFLLIREPEGAIGAADAIRHQASPT